MKKLIGLFLLLMPWSVMIAENDPYPFEIPQQQQRFQHLSASVRCMVCQSQSLAESNAPVAKDLRDKIYNLVKEGKSDHEIKAYLVERYGDFILFEPPFQRNTLILWLAPFILALLGFLVLWLLICRRASDRNGRI